jgi:hypothetical protein
MKRLKVLDSWPVTRQLPSGDALGLGSSVRSPRSRARRPRTEGTAARSGREKTPEGNPANRTMAIENLGCATLGDAAAETPTRTNP